MTSVATSFQDLSFRGEVALAGEIDQQNADSMLADIIDAANSTVLKAVLVDMSGLTFFGAAGLNALVNANNFARSRGQHLVLVNVSWTAQRSLTLAGLENAFPIRAYLS